MSNSFFIPSVTHSLTLLVNFQNLSHTQPSYYSPNSFLLSHTHSFLLHFLTHQQYKYNQANFNHWSRSSLTLIPFLFLYSLTSPLIFSSLFPPTHHQQQPSRLSPLRITWDLQYHKSLDPRLVTFRVSPPVSWRYRKWDQGQNLPAAALSWLASLLTWTRGE